MFTSEYEADLSKPMLSRDEDSSEEQRSMKPTILMNSRMPRKKNPFVKKPLQIAPLSARFPVKKSLSIQNKKNENPVKVPLSHRGYRMKPKYTLHQIKSKQGHGDQDPETDICGSVRPERPAFSTLIPKANKTKSIQDLKFFKKTSRKLTSRKNSKRKIIDDSDKKHRASKTSTKYDSFLNIDQESIDCLFIMHAKKNEANQAVGYLQGQKLRHPANPDTKDKENWGAIHYAVMNNNPIFIQKILEYGGNVDLKGRGGLTALFLSVFA